MKWKIWVPGTKIPVATSIDPRRSRVKSAIRSGEAFTWDRWDLDEVRLTQAAALLTLQGRPLKDLFTNSIMVEPSTPEDTVRVHVYTGPFIYLRGEYTTATGFPRIKKVVLGKLLLDALDLPHQEVLGAMVVSVLTD